MKALLITISLILFASFGFSQNAEDYIFQATSGSYSGLPVAAPNINSIEVDNALSPAKPIGFTFKYCGGEFTQFKASSNGWMTFDLSETYHEPWNNLDDKYGMEFILAPLWDDLSGTPTSSVNAIAKYNTTGSSPNRICTIQWNRWKWSNTATDIVINFQVRLYESDNHIEFIYRPKTDPPSSNASASIGITDFYGYYEHTFQSLDGTGANPTSSTTSETDNLNIRPTDYQMYKWTPPMCSGTPDAGEISASNVIYTCGSSTSFDLSVSRQTWNGATYQWQSSPDNIAWTDISGATNASYSGSVSAQTYYRLVVTCTSSGISSNSNVVGIYIASNANDDCVNAIPLIESSNGGCEDLNHGSLRCASSSGVASSCSGYTPIDDVWYTYKPSADYFRISVSSDNFISYNIYSGTCGSLTFLASHYNDECYGNSMVYGSVTPGQTYYIQVFTKSSYTHYNPSFDICVYPSDECGTPLSDLTNDYCHIATPLVYTPNSTWDDSTHTLYTWCVDNPNEVTDYDEQASYCADGDNTSWYAFVAYADTAVFDFSSLECADGQNMNVQIREIIYDSYGCCGTWTGSTHNNVAWTHGSNACWHSDPTYYNTTGDSILDVIGLTVGETYYLMLDGDGENSACTFSIPGWSISPFPLPVEFLSMNYNCSDNELEWQTASETNNDYFTIKIGTEFTNGKLISEKEYIITGNGNKNSTSNYYYNINENNVYIELWQTDYDGTTEHLNTQYISCNNKQEEFILYPNPASKDKLITIKGEYKTIEIYDIFGNTQSFKITDNKIKGLRQGVYIVVLNKYYRIKLIID